MSPDRVDLAATMRRLALAVDHLEEALQRYERRIDEDAARTQAMRSEAAALRDLQGEVAGRLDSAILRLRSAIGE